VLLHYRWNELLKDVSWEQQIPRSQMVPNLGCRDGVEQLQIQCSFSLLKWGLVLWCWRNISFFPPNKCMWLVVSTPFRMPDALWQGWKRSSIMKPNTSQTSRFTKPYPMANWTSRNDVEFGTRSHLQHDIPFQRHYVFHTPLMCTNTAVPRSLRVLTFRITTFRDHTFLLDVLWLLPTNPIFH